jgi:hypothetical protein
MNKFILLFLLLLLLVLNTHTFTISDKHNRFTKEIFNKIKYLNKNINNSFYFPSRYEHEFLVLKNANKRIFICGIKGPVVNMLHALTFLSQI